MPSAFAARPPHESAVAALDRATQALRAVVPQAADAMAWDAAARARAIRVLDGLAALVTAVRAPLLVAQHTAASEVSGERAFVDTRARLSGTSRAVVTRELGAAHAMAVLPQVGLAVAEHVVPVGHLDVLGRTLAASGPRAGEVLARPETQRELVELARQTDAREFARSVEALVGRHEPEALEDARESARRARFLTLSHGADGTFLRGRLDPLSGQVLARALEATGHREDDDRTGDQARADALTALAQHALTGGLRPSATASGLTAGSPRAGRPHGSSDDPSHGASVGGSSVGGSSVGGSSVGGSSVGGFGATAARDESRVRHDEASLPDGAVSAPAAHVSLLVPAETWLEVREHTRRGRTTARPPGVGARAAPGTPPPAPVATPPAVSDDGVVLTRTELAAALCDCAMARVVMNAQGLPLDVGWSRRMFTPAQRLAVVARDRLCAWNGCSTPARYSQVHHIRWWHRDGGPSDLENSVLLCGFHHHEVHRLDLDVRRLAPVDVAGSGRDADDRDGPRVGLDIPARYEFLDRSAHVVNGPERDPGRGDAGYGP
ncbi:DUF222 domain-containing protein [Cellulomonas palmilytica]|nr:DUF222 domain-containing protein [Cellulomonas palmilytica]